MSLANSVGCTQRHYFTFAETEPMPLDSSQTLGPVTLAYETYGRLNRDHSNAILILHALSGDAHAAGYYALERDGDRLRLEDLFLAPSQIGHGLGRQLFEHAVQTARALRVAELLIESDPNAEGFYLRMGAQRIGQTVSCLTGVERVVPLLRYVLGRTCPKAGGQADSC